MRHPALHPIEREIFERGREAREDGLPISARPMGDGRLWEDGWHYADDELKNSLGWDRLRDRRPWD